ncbi:MAG: ABC transporter ATP-binding protein [Phycisphaerales bacterium]
MAQPLIELKGLTKRFGSSDGILAVDNLTFSVGPGEVLGFLGPNGAGKSTTMKMVTGYLSPTSGTAMVCGHDVSVDPIAVKERVGYLPEGAPLYAEMTPLSFLKFIASTRKLSGERAKEAIEKAVRRTSLEGVLHQPIDTLSKGFKRRVGLAQAILHEPQVLILDEPTDGLDPNQKHEVRQLIRELAAQAGKAIVLSTHILEEVEAVCTRAIIIAKGRIVADAQPAELQSRSRFHNAVNLTLDPPAGTMLFDELRAIDGVADVLDRGRSEVEGQVRVSCTVLAKHGQDIAEALSRLCRDRRWKVDQMRVETGRLEDVFRDLTGGKK